MEGKQAMHHTPVSPLGIIPLRSFEALGEQVDREIVKSRRERKTNDRRANYVPDSYIIPSRQIRFANGEGKAHIAESVRGKDIYILCDVGNYSCTYDMFGFTNHMGPDEHFQDIKRVLSAIGGKARRTTVIMPLLYESRQHRRKSRESLDCAMALQELEDMGVNCILSFDVHDPNIQNAIPLVSFENLYPTYDIVKTIIEEDNDVIIDKDKLIVIAPDTGAMDRAIYYSSVMGLDVGLFFKRRDHSRVVNGKNPIVAHEYMGRDVSGMDVLIVDDMIASGESVLDIAMALKQRGARKINVATTFSLFSEGVAKFDDFHKRGLLERVYSSNLTYISPEVRAARWFSEVDMSYYMARLIDNLNYDRSVAPLLDATGQIAELMAKHTNKTDPEQMRL